MNYLVEAILHLNDRIPGMAFKSRCLDGRVKRPLRALLGFCGTTFVAGGMAIGRVAVRAYQDGSVGFVLLLLLGSAGLEPRILPAKSISFSKLRKSTRRS